jgi:hypothetical protein
VKRIEVEEEEDPSTHQPKSQAIGGGGKRMKSGMGSGRGLTSFFAGSAARFAATWGSSAAVVCGRVPRRNIISSIPRGGGGGGGGGGGRGGKEERGGDQKGGWRRSDGAGWFHVAGGGGAAALVAAAATAGASGLSRGSDSCEDCSRAAMSQGAARYDYVIVGSGLAAVGGLRGIRAVDGGSSTVLVLSLDKGDDVEYGAAGAGLIGAGKEMMKKVTVRNEAAVRLDADNRLVVLRTGEEVSYSKGCLLATGSERVNVDINEISEDAKTRIIQTMGQGGSVVPAKLSKLLKAHEDKGIPEEPHVTVLGGGNASCLMASEIARTGVSVSLAMEEPGPMSTVLPHYLSMHVMWCMRRLGIQVLPQFMPLFRVSSFPSHERPSRAAFFSSLALLLSILFSLLSRPPFSSFSLSPYLEVAIPLSCCCCCSCCCCYCC